ncbi:MAG: ATP-binding protein [Candidatus Brockarchaeota archaeon]|nr:ATP-binding protein [Candidatus Brockarchaeota archaeon]
MPNAAGFRFSENIGKLMENAILIQLRRMRSKNPLLEVFCRRDYQQNEVDFVIKDGMKVKSLIQATYASGRDEVEKREIRALNEASEELKCNDLSMITWDYEDEIKTDDKKAVFHYGDGCLELKWCASLLLMPTSARYLEAIRVQG